MVDIGFEASDSDLEEADRIMWMIHQDHINHLSTPNNSPTATSPASTPLHDHINHQFQLDQLQLRLDRDAALASALDRNLDPLNTHQESPNTSFNLDDDQSFIYISDDSLANNLSDTSLPSLPEISWLPTPPSPTPSSTASAPPLYEDLDHPPAYSHIDREQFLTGWENRLIDRSATLDERSANLDAREARLAALEASLLEQIATLASQ